MNNQQTIEIQESDGLIVVDMQNDFLPGGALAVVDGDKIIPGINFLIEKFFTKHARVILTQDWHPKDHKSFASQYSDKNPFDVIENTPGIGPVLWPDHCVPGTEGAEIHNSISQKRAHLIIRKGFNPNIDSYSTFRENDGKTDTGLAGYLQNSGVKRIFICGLAYDYCVFWSAKDGVEKGFETIIIPELSKAINEETANKATEEMIKKGIKFLKLNDFEK